MPLSALPTELVHEIAKYLTQKSLLCFLKVDRFTSLVLPPLLHNFATSDKAGLPALCWAIQKGYVPLVRILLKKGIDINAHFPKGKNQKQTMKRTPKTTTTDWPYGETALHVAIFFGHKEIVDILCNGGAQLEVLDQNNQMTALHKAAHCGASEIIYSLLYKRAKTNSQQKNGKTALHEAAGYGDIASVRVLLGWNFRSLNYPIIVDIKDRNGATPLHWAAKSGDLTVIRLLLKAGAHVDAQDIAGDTPLIKSAARNLGYKRAGIASVRILLKKGAKPSLKNAKGYTALYFAVLAQKKPMIALLKSYGAK